MRNAVMIVKSITMLSDAERNKIRQILSESKCPNESLRATFPTAYHHMDAEGQVIYFGAHSYDYTYTVYPVRP